MRTAHLLFLAVTIPANLNPPPGVTLFLEANATGDQIYTCDGVRWTLTGPDAKLFDPSGKQIGTHFAGPTWQSADGSRVTGTLLANATPDPDAIPWLLLTADVHVGVGIMQKVMSIQRISTTGGKAPATGCDAEQKGKETRSPYTAVYRFYK